MSNVIIELTDEQAGILLLELNNWSNELEKYAISKPIPVVEILFERVDRLTPIRNVIFKALEKYEYEAAKLAEYTSDEGTKKLPDNSHSEGDQLEFPFDG